MRKSLAVLLACLAVPMVASAQEESEAEELPIKLTWDGYYRFRVRYTHEHQRSKRNQDQADFFPDTSDNFEYLDQRFMVNMDMEVLENIHIKGQFRILDNQTLGRASGGQILSFNPNDDNNNALLGGGDESQFDDTFRAERVWAEVTTDFGRFDFGRMASNWGMGLFAYGGDELDWLWEGQGDDFGDTVDRVRYILFFGDKEKKEGAKYRQGLLIAPLYTRTATNNNDFQTDNANEYVLAVLYSGANFRIGTYDGFREVDAGNQDVLFVDVYGAVDMDIGSAGRLTLETEFFYATGKIDPEATVGGQTVRIPNIDVDGINWALSADMTFGDEKSMKWGVRFDFGVSTGPRDDDLLGAAPVSVPGGVALATPTAVGSLPFDSDFDVDIILFEQYIGAVTNAFYAKLTGHFEIFDLLMDDDSLSGYVSLMYAHAIEDTFIRGRRNESGNLVITDGTGGAALGAPTINLGTVTGGMGFDSIAQRFGSKELGLELDFGVGWRWKQFSLEFEGAVLFQGDAFDLDDDPISNGDGVAILDHINPGTAAALAAGGVSDFISSSGFLDQEDDIVFSTTIQAAVRF